MGLLDKLRKQKLERRETGITEATKAKVQAKQEQQQAERETAQETAAINSTGRTRKKLSLKLGKAAQQIVAEVVEEKPDDLNLNDNGNVEAVVSVETVQTTQPLGKSDITFDMLNDEQRQAVQYGSEGKSFCLIGGAGTGKTTTQRIAVAELVKSGIIGSLEHGTDKVLMTGAPAIAVVSFTNKAVSNIKSALPQEFKAHCSTMHKLVEFKPEILEQEEVDEYGAETGEVIETRRFVPTYGKDKDGYGEGMELPHLDVIIIEEAGSVPTDLFDILIRALPTHENTIFIFLGDLHQLPPVFGDAILGFKLLDLPIVELTKVYRQALLSPITKLATTIQKGRNISDKAMAEMSGDFGEHGSLKVVPFNRAANKLTGEEAEKMSHNFGKHLYKMIIEGDFLLDEDVVLIPFNKRFGTIELNKWIGQAHRDMTDAVTYHVIAGREQYFLCEGDRVMVDKQECRIIEIQENTKYLGEPTIVESRDLDRWGRNRGNDLLQKKMKSFEEMEDILEAVQITDTDEKVNQCSHSIIVESLENVGQHFELTTAAQVNAMLPTGALTIHKSQGSEYRKVVLVLHTSHATMWKRELLYTGCTRARQALEIYYSGEQQGKLAASAFQRGVTKSEFKGVTLEHKLNYFRAKRQAQELTELAATLRKEREGTL